MRTKLIILFATTIFIACQQEEEPNLSPQNDKSVTLEYASVEELRNDVFNHEICDKNYLKSEFVSFQNVVDSLLEYVNDGNLRSEEEAHRFIDINHRFFNLEVDENGELNVNERLMGSNLQNYLNSKGEIIIDDQIYKLSEDNSMLVSSDNSNSIYTSQLTKDVSERRTNVGVQSASSAIIAPGDGDGDLIGGDDNIDTNGNCPRYSYGKDYGCRNGYGTKTMQNGNRRVRYNHSFTTRVCSVTWGVRANSQQKIAAIWWPDKRYLKVYLKIKVNYILYNGVRGETVRGGLYEISDTAYPNFLFYDIVPNSLCTRSSGTVRCYDAADDHYTVDGYYFWIHDDYIPASLQYCDREDICNEQNGPCLDPSGYERYYGETDCGGNCPQGYVCVYGECRQIWSTQN